MKFTRLILLIVVAGLGTSGCAAIGLTGAAIGAGTVSAGAGAVVREGTEYTRGGAVYRTFNLPQAELRLALSDTLARMEMAVITDVMDGDDRRILARARDREIEIQLVPLTRTVTQLKLVVGRGLFGKDRATASEIVVQIERTVEERALAAAARPVRRAERGNGASSPARAARR